MLVPAKPLDITLEIAPKARFDVVDLRSNFAAEHDGTRPLPALPLLVVSHHSRVSGPQSGGAAQRPAHSDLRRRRPNVFSRRAPGTSTTGWSGAATSTRRSGRSSLATRTRTWRSSPAGCGRASRTRTGPSEQVYFVDLDGMNDGRPRRRLARLIAFTRERLVNVHAHRGAGIGAPDRLDQPEGSAPRHLRSSSPSSSGTPACAKGRLRVSLDPTERHSALTVNEYETLLMRHDLAEVLRNPLRFVAEKSRHALANPRAVPAQDARLREIRHGARAQQRSRRARPARVHHREGDGAHARGPCLAGSSACTVRSTCSCQPTRMASRASSRERIRAPSSCSGRTRRARRAS